MKKMVLAVLVISMLLLCSVVTFAKDEETEKSYIELTSKYFFTNDFQLSLAGEYYYDGIYHLKAKVYSDFSEFIGFSLHNNVRVISISEYNLGTIITYDMFNSFAVNGAMDNVFGLGLYGNKLFIDKLDVTLGVSTYYALTFNALEVPSTEHAFGGLKVFAGVDYGVTDKLYLSLNASINLLSLTPLVSNCVNVDLGAKYKLTNDLSLLGKIGVVYAFEPVNSYDLTFEAGIRYKFNFGLSVGLGVQSSLSNGLYNDTVLSLSLRYTF